MLTSSDIMYLNISVVHPVIPPFTGCCLCGFILIKWRQSVNIHYNKVDTRRRRRIW